MAEYSLQELDLLLDRLCEGSLEEYPDAVNRLVELVSESEACRHRYLDTIELHAALWRMGGDESSLSLDSDAEIAMDSHVSEQMTLPESHFSLSNILSTACHGTIGFFSQELPFSLLVATVLTSLGLWAASLVYVSGPEQIATVASAPVRASIDPTLEFVGKITGMVDCHWSKDGRAPNGYDNVLVGRQFKLDSGLMEITYDSGARVILQGPTTYEVESRDGGFLSLGKLTARLEKKAEGGRRKAEDSNSQSPSSLASRPSPLFTIKTPTATVTDLGTEFGVEVTKEGYTTSHVFRGSVKLQPVGLGKDTQSHVLVLHENESAHVGKNTDGNGRIAAPRRIVVDPQAFTRRILQPPKMLDLLDVVAGGYGSVQRRERGIDPTTGQEIWAFTSGLLSGDSQYHTINWHTLIDGVFIPKGGAGPVVLDSAGHAFKDFPRTSGNMYCPIWARATTIPSDERANDLSPYWVYAMGPGTQYMPGNRGLLGMHANSGITFKLKAMGEVYQGMRPVRFKTVAGVTRKEGMSDIWVFIDGRLKYKRQSLRMQEGAVHINVEISNEDRFLTLVSTEGSDGLRADWVVFGDPVIEMRSIAK